MPDFIGIDISGNKEIADKLGGLYAAVADAGVEEANDYIVRAERLYPPYAHIPISAVGGFVSDRQRRYVMAKIASGEITPGRSNRTQRLAQGWGVIGEGVNQIVVNEVDYAPYVVGDREQTQMHMLQNWSITSLFLRERMSEIVRHFDAGVKNAIRKLGLS
jgi:hypothetical protein